MMMGFYKKLEAALGLHTGNTVQALLRTESLVSYYARRRANRLRWWGFGGRLYAAMRGFVGLAWG